VSLVVREKIVKTLRKNVDRDTSKNTCMKHYEKHLYETLRKTLVYSWERLNQKSKPQILESKRTNFDRFNHNKFV
jgi:hypothetical protein